jgi:hypothetical protein
LLRNGLGFDQPGEKEHQGRKTLGRGDAAAARGQAKDNGGQRQTFCDGTNSHGLNYNNDSNIGNFILVGETLMAVGRISGEKYFAGFSPEPSA